MIRTAILDRNQKPTKEQIQQIEEAAKRTIVFDEDSPELTPAVEKAFRLAAKKPQHTKENKYIIIFQERGVSSQNPPLCTAAKARRAWPWRLPSLFH